MPRPARASNAEKYLRPPGTVPGVNRPGPDPPRAGPPVPRPERRRHATSRTSTDRRGAQLAEAKHTARTPPVVATRPAGATRSPPPADLAGATALVLVRPTLDRLPGPAHAHPDRAADSEAEAAKHPLARRADPGQPTGGAGRAVDLRAGLAGERWALVTKRPHTPLRPLWLCRRCGASWPCGSARLTLLREYGHDQVALIIYLGGLLYEATEQLHALNPREMPDAGQLFDRFLGWHRSRTSGPYPSANLTNGGGCRAEHVVNEVRSE